MSDAVVIAVIVTIGSVVTASIGAMALVQSRQTHLLINSRMEQLLKAARALAHAEGVAEGEQQERDREGQP